MAQIARIAPRSILTVPNFAYWRHRSELLLSGRMPVSAELPYPWYQTPNIHLSTLPDTASATTSARRRRGSCSCFDAHFTVVSFVAFVVVVDAFAVADGAAIIEALACIIPVVVVRASAAWS